MKLKALLILTGLITAGFGLWPFGFLPVNAVKHLPKESALAFGDFEEGSDSGRGRGIAFTERALPALNGAAFSILLEWSGKPSEGGLGVVFECFDLRRESTAILKVATWKSHLAIRSGRNREHEDIQYQEIGYKDAVPEDRFRAILFVSEPRGTTVAMEGRETQFYPGFELVERSGTELGRLAFGNDPLGNQPFTGAIREFAIFDRAISLSEALRGAEEPLERFSFRGEPSEMEGRRGFRGSGGTLLVVPDRMKPPAGRWLRSLSFERVRATHFQRDIAVNLFGFIPMGFLLAGLLARKTGTARSLIYASLICAAFSFGIEMAQGWLVFRDSSQLDLLLNAAGGGIGAFLAYFSGFQKGARSGRMFL